jgi:hypothetical protein
MFQVVAIGMTDQELRSIESSLSGMDHVRLLAFDTTRQLAANCLRQPADLILLRQADHPLQQGLKWIRRNWPHSLCAVCAETNQDEIAIRSHGAMFFLAPTGDDLQAILEGALQNRKARRHSA